MVIGPGVSGINRDATSRVRDSDSKKIEYGVCQMFVRVHTYSPVHAMVIF